MILADVSRGLGSAGVIPIYVERVTDDCDDDVELQLLFKSKEIAQSGVSKNRIKPGQSVSIWSVWSDASGSAKVINSLQAGAARTAVIGFRRMDNVLAHGDAVQVQVTASAEHMSPYYCSLLITLVQLRQHVDVKLSVSIFRKHAVILCDHAPSSHQSAFPPTTRVLRIVPPNCEARSAVRCRQPFRV